MLFEMLVGLEVIDDDAYQAYRSAMKPILAGYGGSFGYDFKIAETLLSETPDNINRVFTIQFPSMKIMDQFFSDPDYLSAKTKYFESSVRSTTILASYEKNI
ncbi:DUF1330 domain-containing protein [Microbulbifer echini]|uniref:DUF1330 domain-containing protein n=1 Tax=Microbulbifer echini TaxID=1529067 RepID=A0ABV4NPX4_9GAMM